MAITMFLDSIYLNWVQRRFQNASAHSEAAARLLDAGPGPEQGGALNAYFSRNPVLQLLQSNHTWLKLLGNSTGDDDALSRSHAYGNSSRGAAAFDANVREYHPYLVVAMALSLMFLLLICTAYCVLPELRNTHGKNLVSLSCCFIVLYVGFIVDFTFRSHVPHRLCLAMAVVQHTSFLAVFFWTNVMAFDVWQAIVTLRSMANPRIRQDHYWQYAAYAWTATVVVSAPAVLFQFTELVPHEYRPRFGEKKCWLGGYLAYALYFNLPVGIILLCNVVIFGMTAWALYQARTMQKVTLQAKQHKKM